IFDFSHTTVETLTLAVANTSVSPPRALVCSDGSGASCDIVFSSAGCSSGNTCATTFADAATNSSSNGSIQFEGWGRLRNNPDTVLASKNVIHNNARATTCGSDDCTASGTTVPPLTATFISNTSTDDLPVVLRTHNINHNDYQHVTVNNFGYLNMNSGYSTYYFKSLTVGYWSAVYLTAGDYYIDELEVKDHGTIAVSGSGTVRIFAKNKAVFSGSSSVNDGWLGDASQFFLYYMNSGGKVQLSSSTVAGFIYSKGGVEMTGYGLRFYAAVYGGVSAEGQISLKRNSFIYYRAGDLENSDFGGACDSSGSAVHHYQFEYDASGLTCKTQEVKIKACVNAACDSLYESESTLSLVATNGELNSVTTDLTFTKEITVELAEILPTTIKLSMNSASPSADLECYENGQLEASCDYKLEDSGFIFVNEDDNNLIIPSQISGKPSNIGYNKKTITLQAVQTDTTTGACTDFFANNTEVVVNLAYQCEDPGSCKVYQCLDPNNCPSNAVTITNNGKTNPLKEYSSYASHNLLFGIDSKATIAITYPDAGKIKLHAQRSIVLSPNKTTDMKGTSNSFVVRPFGFYMNIGMNPGSTDNSGNVFTRAGETFDMTLSSVIWQAGEDDDNNGEPDAGADLSNNPVTLNFGNEISGEQATIATALVSPAVGNNPPLVNSNFTAFLAGRQSKVGTNGVSWGDVGVVSFTAAGDGNYIDSGDNITTTIPHVGRFVPDHFKLKSSSLNQACTSFSYMDQRVNLAINIEAQGVGDIPLLNYDSAPDSDNSNDSGNDNQFHGKSVVSLVAENNNLGVDLGHRFSGVSLDWENGEINTTFATSFSRLQVISGMDGPYDNLIAGIKVDDGDAHAVINLTGVIANMNVLDMGDCTEQGDCDAVKLHAGEVKYRYGRLASSPVFGPATNLINAPIQTEYWDSKSFVLSLDDSCSTLQASDIDLSGNSASPFADRYDVKDLTSHAKNGSLTVNTSSEDTSTTQLDAANGYFYLTLNPPIFDTGNTGYVPVTINAAAYPWLQYDWGTFGKGAVDALLPIQNVTFGQFRGNDRVIYWREKL
ncbi:MAG: hypothetical protein MJK04_07780, partial [Psychrosphaera sp.]|nr:hypothetical protein [Psychrosphaera sp.]